jgi:hypothetical protein
VTSKTEGKIHNDNMLIKYDARLRDNVAVNIVTDVTNAVQKQETGTAAPLSVIPTGGGQAGKSSQQQGLGALGSSCACCGTPG